MLLSIYQRRLIQIAITTCYQRSTDLSARWLSCYLRGRQAQTCFRGVKSSSRKVNTGIPQGSKLSPSLFSFYMSDMPMPTEPVDRVCYDLTVWATGVKIPDMEITAYLKDNSLLISAPKSSVTLFTPSQTPPENTHRRLTATSGTMPKDFRVTQHCKAGNCNIWRVNGKSTTVRFICMWKA